MRGMGSVFCGVMSTGLHVRDGQCALLGDEHRVCYLSTVTSNFWNGSV